jgi:hypothetical protein
MIQGVLTRRFRNEYSENLLPILNGNLNINSGTNATIEYDTSIIFDANKSIKHTFVSSGDENTINYQITGYNTTIKNNGKHILSYRFFKSDSSSDISFRIKLYVNGILTETIEQNLYPDNWVNDVWNCYFQSFYFNQGDLISFRFECHSDIIDSELYFDALKLEHDDRSLGIPSMYSVPISESFITGFQSRVDTTNTQTLIGLTDNLISFSGTLEENGNLDLLDTNSKITPISLNDVITMDFAFTGVTPAGSNLFLTILLKVDGVIYRALNLPIIKGAGLDDYFSVSWALPVGASFLANGGEIYVNPKVGIDIKNRYINVSRTHKGI